MNISVNKRKKYFLISNMSFNGWPKIFWTKCLFTFDQLEIADESKAMS
jgi:hypothetical protein